MVVIPDILEEFINQIPMAFDVVSFTSSGGNTIIEIENIYYLRIGNTVDIDGNQYTLLSSDFETSTFVIPGVLASADIVTISNPFFWHGTPIMTSSLLTRIADTKDKFPCIYLYEIVRENFGGHNQPFIGTDLRLYFLDRARYEEWDTDKQYSLVIKPMREYVERFVEQARGVLGRKYFIQDDEFTLVNHVNFGRFREGKGHEKNLFNNNTSGIEMQWRVNFNKSICN